MTVIGTSDHCFPCHRLSWSSISSAMMSLLDTISRLRRLRATSCKRLAIRESRCISACRSWALSTSRLVRMTAVTLAHRRVSLQHGHFAEEMTDAEACPLVPGSSISTSPAATEIHRMARFAAPYDEFTGLDPAAPSRVQPLPRSRWHPTRKTGECVYYPQVTTKSRRWI